MGFGNPDLSLTGFEKAAIRNSIYPCDSGEGPWAEGWVSDVWPGCFCSLCDALERQSGTNSAHLKFLLDRDVKARSIRGKTHAKVIFCTVIL